MAPKQSPSLYSIPKTFMWFALVSILLTACLVGIVWTDYNREWKGWQKKFITLKMEKAEAELKTASQKIDKTKLEDLKKQKMEAEKTFASHKAAYGTILKSIEDLGVNEAKVKSEYQTEKQFQDSYKYYYEEYEEKKDKRASQYKAKLDAINPKVAALKLKQDGIEKEIADKTALSKEFLLKEEDLKKRIDAILADQNRLATRVEKIRPSAIKDILNAPMLDFLAPSLQVQQVVLEDLQDDYHFAKVQKVDRCITCHLGIDQKGFENAPQPFKTHPKLDLYLGSSSRHPIEKFGCTTCHGGNGHSVSFKDSAHTPQNEKQGEEWHKKYNWEELEKWDAKMLPLNYTEASCAKCHNGTVEIPKADKLNKGRKLAAELGCLNCHKITGFEDAWKVGPDLQNVKSKLDHDWLVKWIENPREFRDSTTMPRIFNLSNTSSPEDVDRNNAAIAGVAHYLISHSETIELQTAKGGDLVKGEKLVKELGCLGCHTAAGVSAAHFGPELSGLGSKVSSDWLYTWLKNPKHYSKDTRMPNMRLSDEEASDITAYLLSQKNEKFDSQALPAVKGEVVDKMIVENLQSTLRLEEAKSKVSGMSQDEKLDFLGKKTIEHQGCFSCHSIKGFEASKPIGADLSNEGHKLLQQFDFGFAEIEHSRNAWIYQKLKDPRIFDHGKIKGYYEKLRMPQFNLTDEQIDELTTFILGLTHESVPLQMQKRLNQDEMAIEKGRLLLAKYNCAGCHTVDGKIGSIRSFTADEGANPPILDGEGAKVQEVWLYHFLQNPTPIRPWLTYRMPTFGLEEKELTEFVHYFNNLSKQEASYNGEVTPPTTDEKLAAGKKLFDTFQCVKCHQISSDSAAMGASFLAPDLTLTKQRLKAEWVKHWMQDPQALQEGTMMPTFFSDGESPVPDVLGGKANDQIEAIRDYLYRYEQYTSQESDKKPVAKS